MTKPMIKCIQKWILLMICFPCFSIHVYGQDAAGDMLTKQMDLPDFEAVDTVLRSGNYTQAQISFKDLVMQAVNGQLDLSIGNILKEVSKAFFGELYANSDLMRNLLIIAILSALLKNSTESFRNKAVGELGFYVSYIVLIMVLFSAFHIALGITEELIFTLTEFMQASLPLMMSLLVMSGSIASSYAFHPILVFIIHTIASFITNFLAPLIILAASLEIVNYITEKQILTNFSALLKNVCSWSMKGICFVFLGVLSLQKISAPILNNAVAKTAKVSINAIPVVGQVLNGAVDVVLYWAVAVKSGAMVALIILTVMMCAIPVIKILVLICVFKFTAAIVQPVSDIRIVKCIDSIGSFTFLLLGVSVTVIVMFILSVVIMLSF